MEIGSIVIGFQVTSWLEVVRVGIVDLVFILVEDLEFEEVDTLLEKVHISEVFNMKHELSTGAIHIYILLLLFCVIQLIWLI